MLLYFGRKGLNRADAWREKPWGDDFIKQIFPSRRRFDDIFACWHMVDNDHFSAKDRRADKYWQSRPLILMAQKSFRECYIAFQRLGLDEQVHACKVRHPAKQFNPAKPAKWHIKNFVLADTKNGFIVEFHPYQGKDAENTNNLGLADFAVTKLVTERFWDKKYLVGYDNWFSTERNHDHSAEKKYIVTTTFRKNRKGFPPKSQLTLERDAPRGSYKVLKHPTKEVILITYTTNVSQEYSDHCSHITFRTN